MTMNFLRLPSQKVFAQHLVLATETRGSSNFNDTGTLWNCQLPSANNSNFILPSVWVQGVVVEMLDQNNTVVLDDGTGIILLSLCDKLPSKISFFKGMYIMAVGSFEIKGSHPEIRPIKVQDLSSVQHADTMWPLEVLDQRSFLNT